MTTDTKIFRWGLFFNISWDTYWEKSIQFVPSGFRLFPAEDGAEVVRDIERVEPAALCKGMHEGMSFGRLLAPMFWQFLSESLLGLTLCSEVQFNERIVSKEDKYDIGCEMVVFSNSRGRMTIEFCHRRNYYLSWTM